jgi:hypothetical protein
MSPEDNPHIIFVHPGEQELIIEISGFCRPPPEYSEIFKK